MHIETDRNTFQVSRSGPWTAVRI